MGPCRGAEGADGVGAGSGEGAIAQHKLIRQNNITTDAPTEPNLVLTETTKHSCVSLSRFVDGYMTNKPESFNSFFCRADRL